MSLKPEEETLLQEETDALAATLQSLFAQRQETLTALSVENIRARELTSALVQTRRAEDKALLCSDEAVSHALSHKKTADITTLDKLIEKPYFARFVVEEDIQGRQKKIEYKLGFSANTDCRIMDWRRAPISKLYYEYKEGEEYAEEIRGQERVGRIVLRNAVEIEKQRLSKVTCRYGTFKYDGSTWLKSGGSGPTTSAHEQGGLPPILSLITSEQFKTITEEATTPILIQGVAGSGKTTVALHRLAWLLHEDNAGIKPEECVFIVLSPVLKAYVSNTLPAIGIDQVKVMTFEEFMNSTLTSFLPHLKNETGALQRPSDSTPSSILRLKCSIALLKALEQSANLALEPEAALIDIFSRPKLILENDETKLLSADIVAQARDRLIRNKESGTIDRADDPLFFRLYQLKNKAIRMHTGPIGRYKHIMVDEVQDLSPLDLACILEAVDDTNHLTLVGDTAQSLGAKNFLGWDKLREHWGAKNLISRFITLAISHRSSLPIMKLADYIQGRSATPTGRAGRVPIWFQSNSESSALEATINWLEQATQRYPNAVTCVACADADQAKELYGLLRPSFGSGLRLGQTDSFSFEQGIVVGEISQIRGLEFVNVLIWNPTARFYPLNDQARNLLYIAVTRASDNLCLVTTGKPSPILPSAGRGLLRVVVNS